MLLIIAVVLLYIAMTYGSIYRYIDHGSTTTTKGKKVCSFMEDLPSQGREREGGREEGREGGREKEREGRRVRE